MWKHKWPKYIDPVPVAVGDADGLLCSILRFGVKSLPRPFWEWDRSAFGSLYSSPIPSTAALSPISVLPLPEVFVLGGCFLLVLGPFSLPPN